MRIMIGKLLLGLAAVVLCIAPSALADTSMDLTSPGNNPVDGVYVGPYYATVNGVANTPVICDDFTDESYVPETWSATSTSVAGVNALSPVDFFGVDGQQGYNAVASLSETLFGLSPSDPTYSSDAAVLQYAIWDIFNNGSVSTFLAGDPTLLADAKADAAAALGASYAAGSFSNILILTPDSSQPMSCSTTSGELCPPQEFIVQTPEPGTFGLLAIGLLMLGIFARRKYFVASSTVSA
jgi:PEP-CTERM motif